MIVGALEWSVLSVRIRRLTRGEAWREKMAGKIGGKKLAGKIGGKKFSGKIGGKKLAGKIWREKEDISWSWNFFCFSSKNTTFF